MRKLRESAAVQSQGPGCSPCFGIMLFDRTCPSESAVFLRFAAVCGVPRSGAGAISGSVGKYYCGLNRPMFTEMKQETK